MTTLAIGASITVSLRDDGICRVASNGGFSTVVITPTVGSASVVSIGPEPTRQAFGPFAEGASLVMNNRSCGSFDYESPGVDLANVAITGGTINGAQTGEYYGVSSQSLKKWRRGLARARNGGAVAQIACVGDSTVRGAWSNGSSGTNCVIKSWPVKLAGLLSAAGTPASAESFFGDGTFGVPLSTIDPRVVLGVAWTANANTSLGGKMHIASAAGTLSFTPNQPMKSYDIYYPINSGLGTFSIDIGGVGATPIVTAGTMAFGKSTITNTGAASVSPLNIAWTSGACLVIGAQGRSLTDQVTVLNMGRSGSVVADWTANTSSAWDSLLALPLVAPDLTIISLTINDWVAGTSIATYTANMQALINSALQTGDVLLLTAAPSNTANASLSAQQAIITASYQLAATNSLPLLDMTNRFTSYAVSQPLGLYGDTALHPSGIGYADIATSIVKALAV